MHKLLSTLTFIIVTLTSVIAQENPMEGLCFNPDKPAEFPGGKTAMEQYFNENLKYPTDALINGVEGRVMCQFIIHPDSTRTNINIVRKVHPSIDAEMQRLIENMPQWTPATKDNIPVKTLVTLPLIFKLPEDSSVVTDDEVYIDGKILEIVDQMPEFPGGTAGLMKYLADNVRYPVEAAEKGVQGRVICKFTVWKDGTIRDIEIIKSADKSLEREAVRLIKRMPKWRPGMLKNGVKVNCKFSIPINFKLGDTTTKNFN